mmetsp:Transcript_20466/g.44756  ORF Transcript_20466/g.44756 Transcript_20466/m.44756 type:complete len:342 (+) Transcript_20466:872-1897(+)
MSPPPPLVDVSHDLSFLWHEPSKHGLNAANTWHQLGLVLATIDRNEEALSALHMALEIRRNQLGDCDLVAISLEALGDEYSKIYQLTGEKKAADEADQGYFESIRIREKICGHHSVVANVLFKQADLKRRLSDTDEAISMFTRCYAMRKEELGEHHPLVALTLYCLGCAMLDKDDVEGAAQPFAKIMETRAFESADMDGMSDNAIDIPAAFALAGQTLARVAKLEMAGQCFDEAIRAKSQEVGDCAALAGFVDDIGTFFEEQGLDEESWIYYDKADAVRERVSSRAFNADAASFHGGEETPEVEGASGGVTAIQHDNDEELTEGEYSADITEDEYSADITS